MKKILAILVFCVFPTIVSAQILPDAFRVTGVAANDVLNIRAEPNARAPIVGTLDPFATNIEVLALSDDRKWGRVSANEGNGWASMRYLEATNHTAQGELPRPMTCFGTEPFWALAMYPGGDEYELAGEGRRSLSLVKHVMSHPGYVAIFEELSGLTRTLTISRGWCSDGMSDRDYGWSATLFNETAQGDSLLFGCCTLDLR